MVMPKVCAWTLQVQRLLLPKILHARISGALVIGGWGVGVRAPQMFPLQTALLVSLQLYLAV